MQFLVKARVLIWYLLTKCSDESYFILRLHEYTVCMSGRETGADYGVRQSQDEPSTSDGLEGLKLMFDRDPGGWIPVA